MPRRAAQACLPRCTDTDTQIRTLSVTDTQIPRYAHIYTDTQIHRYAHTDTQIRTHRYTDTHTQIHRYAHRYTDMQIRTHTQRYTHTHTKIHTHTHKDTHTHTHTHTPTKIHPHTHSLTQAHTLRSAHILLHGTFESFAARTTAKSIVDPERPGCQRFLHESGERFAARRCGEGRTLARNCCGWTHATRVGSRVEEEEEEVADVSAASEVED
jgi:hypothetical protein